MAATEPLSQALAIGHPGVRPQTRQKIIEILSGTANGCLQELGYSPGLLEKVHYLEESLAKVKGENEKLKVENEKLKAENEKLKNFAPAVEDLRKKAFAYQQENVQMYEDNTKLFAECEFLRQELTKLRMLASKNEETRGKDVTEILRDSSGSSRKISLRLNPSHTLLDHIPFAPSRLQRLFPASRFAARRARNSLRTRRNPSPCKRRRRALTFNRTRRNPSPRKRMHRALMPPSHSPQSFAPQSHAPAPQIQPHPAQPYALQTQGQPYHVPSNGPPRISMNGGLATIHPLRRQSAPVNWQPAISPTSASQVAPPPGYGPYSVRAGVPPPLSHRPGSGASMSPGVGGHRTPTTFPPTSPISELPLNLQNFASPTMPHAPPPHPQTRPNPYPLPQAQHPHPLPPRTASASSAPRTHSQPQSPALPPEFTHTPPTNAQIPAFVTRDGHMVRAALSPERRPSMDSAPQMQVDVVPQTRSPRQHASPDADARAGGASETPMDSIQETPMDVAPETEAQMDVATEMQDVSSPPEVHEAVTPPVDASSAFSVAVAEDASSGINGDGSVVASLKEEVEPTVKMEVDDDVGGDGADEEEEEEDVELGPDGLRTARDCVATIFDADRNYICEFCETRHKSDLEKGLPSEPPPEMPNATMEELVAHCEKEHEYVWNILRRNAL
ncbi:hypothetical protein MSAN_01474800 [Mycena sanguinolenta]|uniref:Uncharacterized protein n=1 Tax=Mycena sanguinolenta TaxID=230812 RepID=A0A8H6YBA6_9AGAR|nr:hypothetical protein MSAN_01474800 [Mycena sanguinolenta]